MKTENGKEALTIVELRAENFMRLKAVRVRPDGSLIVIGGRNAQGKTSLLDSIACAIGGKKLCPDDPIRHGEQSAFVEVDFEEFKVRRTFYANGKSDLKMTDAEGATIKGPQAILDSMNGTLSFDPLAFSRASKKEQVAMLVEVTGLDLTEIERAIGMLYETRTDANREMKSAKAIYDAADKFLDAPAAEKSLEELLGEIRDARQEEAKGEELRRQRDTSIESKKRIEVQIMELQNDLASMDAVIDSRQGQVDAFLMPNVEDLEEQLTDLEEQNRKARANKTCAEAKATYDACVAESNDLTLKLKAKEQEKKEMLADTKLPYPGMMFDEHGVMLNGVPFEQASAAEQLRVSVAMGQAMSPELKIMLVRDGSLLDAESLAELARMAEKGGGQFWTERVGDGPEVSVLIEDGEVVEGGGT